MEGKSVARLTVPSRLMEGNYSRFPGFRSRLFQVSGRSGRATVVLAMFADSVRVPVKPAPRFYLSLRNVDRTAWSVRCRNVERSVEHLTT